MKGIYSALLTSFDREGNINEKGIREIVRYNIDKMKVDGLYVGGSTGENFMLSTDEKKEIFRIVKDEAKDKVKLIAQVGSINLKESIELGKFSTELGYDSLSAVTPFYYKFSFDEIKDYYDTIIRECKNKMIIYSIPALTGVNMSIENFKELFKNEDIIGVKFTAPDFYLLERIRKEFSDKLIFSGFDEMLLSALVLGVDGAIGSTFNVNGIRTREIFELVKDNKIKEAREVQHITNDLITDILNNGLYQTIKLILEEFGVEAGECKRPFKEATQEMKKRAKDIFLKYFS
ncbi:N-acetylneuraminate lyase [Candidatus Arthromitus sp. SFB-turkey]|uniref:N-acetylneuraminate lyase n=1 Tax=Candidatus Arthromitus sp. SFB-turkey TaxID=1840217 RepID=UPI0007F40496|nr:N-acetylneuraminate lyase [Candidatus Arthromitus sp. SFB-turkey]OAT86956.1 N-acetylneuraminate lyase [Candidatus Arthromitus sp. SFB-turkey]HJD00789.1 N-acetylneuraminate lyase [Candidatus Dwaynia gallinarum]